jgi:hypothetical protein
MAQDGLFDLQHAAETADGIPRRPVEIMVPSTWRLMPSSRPAMATFCGPKQKSPKCQTVSLGCIAAFQRRVIPRRALRWSRTGRNGLMDS